MDLIANGHFDRLRKRASPPRSSFESGGFFASRMIGLVQPPAARARRGRDGFVWFCDELGGLLERDDFFFEPSSRSIFLFEHDLFRKPVPTFPDHALTPRRAADRTPGKMATGERRGLGFCSRDAHIGMLSFVPELRHAFASARPRQPDGRSPAGRARQA